MVTVLESYDQHKVGRFISWGGDHTVFLYGDSEVIKSFFICKGAIWRNNNLIKFFNKV